MFSRIDNRKGFLLASVVVLLSLLALKANPQQVTATQPFTYPLLKTATACAALGTGGPPASAACSAAPAGAVANPAGSNTLTVNTTAVTTNSQIFIEYDESVSISGVTCNTTSTARAARYLLTGRSAGTSFTITPSAVPSSGNPVCLSFFIVN
jgi:hypothetical protein